MIDPYFIKYYYDQRKTMNCIYLKYSMIKYTNMNQYYDVDNNFDLSDNDLNDLISVIIPTYNREKKIISSIISILNQTYTNYEIIIVDDGSTDNTEHVINALQNQPFYNKIKYIKLPENKGCWNARNVGIQNSNGKYIIFNDSDDISSPNRIEILYKTIKKYNLLFVGSQMYRTHIVNFDIPIDINEIIKTIEINKNTTLKMNPEIKHNSQCCKPIFGIATIMYDKKIFDVIGLYHQYKVGTDADFLERFLNKYRDIKNSSLVKTYEYFYFNRFAKKYCIIEDVLYYSSEFDNSNLSV